MTKNRILIAILILIAPLAVRFFWFYQGGYQRTTTIETPDFAAIPLPSPMLSTRLPVKPITSQQIVQKQVLIDQSHGNLYYLNEINALSKTLGEMGVKISITGEDPNLGSMLKTSDAFIVIAPATNFSVTEVSEIKSFIDKGGRLLVIADPTRNYSDYATTTSLEATNLLLENFRIKFNNDYLYNLVLNEGNFRNIRLIPTGEQSLLIGIQQVVFFSTHSIDVRDGAILSGDKNTLSSITDSGDNLPAAALSKDQSVLALGDFSFLQQPYSQYADNEKFIRNIANFLTGGEIKHDLENRPFIFNRSISVLASKGITLDQILIDAIGKLQDDYSYLHQTVQLVEKPETGTDRILLGLYPPKDKEIKDTIKELGIEFSTSADTEDETLKPTKESTEEMTEEDNTPVKTRTPAEKETKSPKDDEKEESLSTFDEDLSNEKSSENGEDYDTITIPKFGKFKSQGIALFLYDPKTEQNTLTILGLNNAAVLDALDKLGSDDLSGCIIRGNIGICQVSDTEDTGSDYLTDSSFNEGILDEPATDVPTSTPAG